MPFCPECGGEVDTKHCTNCGTENPKYKSSGGGCFIATCIYGELAQETNTLREWRDTSLIKSHIGRCFVNIYYKVSPHIVEVIKDKPVLKKVIKSILNSVVAIIKNKNN